MFSRVLRSRWWRRMAIFLAVLGPGLITANVDNDANGIATYSIAGASYGVHLLWVLALVTVALIVVQEMCTRMGCITGKGLADLIREHFGVKVTLWLMATLVLANLANTIGNFAGLAAGAELLGVTKYLAVPAGALCIWWLVVKGSYQRVEKVFLWACLMYLTYVASGFMAHPNWSEVGRSLVTISLPQSSEGLILIIAMVGTTIAPWMQFYQQSSVRDKGLGPRDYKYSRWDTVLGAAAAAVIALFIVISCAYTLHLHGQRVETAADAAMALGPLAGRWATLLFAAGLVNAALFSVAIIPLSTAYAVCEAFGWESGVGWSFTKAPAFYSIYTGLIVISAGVILLPDAHLIQIMLFSQALNGLLLPIVLVAMLILINRKALMGTYVNGWVGNAIAWATVAGLIVATLALVAVTLWPNLAPHAAAP